MEGQPHALASLAEPAYLTTGDPGNSGGGTLQSYDTQRLQAGYENVFGPAAREIKWDSQRHKRHQRWHLPDTLKGANSFLTDRIDGLITDATSSPFTKNILPYMYKENPDGKIKWNVYSFDEGLATRVPYESAARVLPQSKRSFAGYAVRQGIAIAMEHNFMMSPEGMQNFRRQLMQLVGSIQLTNDLDVHMALLHAPSHQKHMDEKYWDNTKTLSQQCRMYVDMFGFVQKNENALDYIIEDAKNHLTSWGSKPPTFMLCNGALTRQLTMNPEKTNFVTAGIDGQRKLAQGPDLPSYRGLSIINTRKFSLETGSAPRDMLRRRVRVGEHYRIAWHISNMRKRYEFYDQSRDSMFYLNWIDLYHASKPAEAALESMIENAPVTEYAPLSEEFLVQLRRASLAAHIGVDAQDANRMFHPSDLFSETELRLGVLLGFWSREMTANDFAPILQDITIVYSQILNVTKEYATCTLKNIPQNVSNYLQALILIKYMFRMYDLKPDERAYGRYLDGQEMTGYQYREVTLQFLVAYVIAALQIMGIDENGVRGPIRPGGAFEIQDLICLFGQKCVTLNSLPIKYVEATSLPQDNFAVICFATDLFLLRPNIEHNMLAVILGRGGGPDELGATFWGQTELSCYDDAQHGIWGMSYKYHERAIVLNERNLVRVFDVCFDGYCGGNDAKILKWDEDSVNEFKQKTKDLSVPYNGPSFIVMALPIWQSVYDVFPNPVVWHPHAPSAGRFRVQPDGGSNISQGLAEHLPFCLNSDDTQDKKLFKSVYNIYYNFLGLASWWNMHAQPEAGVAAFENQTDPYAFSFHGHMATILDGQREEIQGSGHLGSNFVGVASVREGRGMLPRGMPTLAHLV
jgi:hypothetical protein